MNFIEKVLHRSRKPQPRNSKQGCPTSRLLCEKWELPRMIRFSSLSKGSASIRIRECLYRLREKSCSWVEQRFTLH
jgi:hypothetical protein